MNLSSVDLNLLRIADVLLERRSITETAKAVGLSQPALSHALSRLREQLRDPLLVRERRAMVLTPFAQRLRPRLRSALGELDRALRDSEPFEPRTATGILRVACADYAEVAFIPAALRWLDVEAPLLDLMTAPYVEPFEVALERGDVDLVVGPRPSDKSWIGSTKLFSSGWVSVGRRGHPWFRRPTLDAFCRAGHVMVSSEAQQGVGPADAALALMNRRRRVRMRVPQFAGALTIAAQTDLLFTTPQELGTAAARILPLEIAKVPFAMPSDEAFMSWHEARSAEPRLLWIRDAVARIVASSSKGARRGATSEERLAPSATPAPRARRSRGRPR